MKSPTIELVHFTNYHKKVPNNDVYVNPAYVALLAAYTTGVASIATSIHLAGVSEYIVVNGTPSEVAAALGFLGDKNG